MSTLTNPLGEFRLEDIGSDMKLRMEAAGYYNIHELNPNTDQKMEVLLAKENTGEYAGRVLDADTKKPVTDYWITYGDAPPFSGAPRNDLRVLSQEGRILLNELSSDKECSFSIHAENELVSLGL